MERDELPRTRADEEILASGDAVPPEILEPSAASIVASRRKERENAAPGETPQPDADQQGRNPAQ